VKSGNARNGHIWKGMVTKNEYIVWWGNSMVRVCTGAVKARYKPLTEIREYLPGRFL
jgi:hypothetical protein